MQGNDSIIRIGTSLMTPHQFLMDLWPQIHAMRPELKYQVVNFENTPENARGILSHLGQKIDIVAGIFDDTMLRLRGCAVSIYHPLAQRNLLIAEDRHGQKLMLMKREWSEHVDRLRDELWQEHPQIELVDFSFYNVDVFNQCENNGALLMAVPFWASVHPFLKIIPVAWEHAIPFGLLHVPASSPIVQKLLDVVRKILPAA